MAFSDNIFSNVPVGNSSHLPFILSSGSLKNSPSGGHFMVYIIEKVPWKVEDAVRGLGRAKIIYTPENREPGLLLIQWTSGKLQKIQEIFIDLGEGGRQERERERENINLLFDWFMHSLFASCMSPNWG